MADMDAHLKRLREKKAAARGTASDAATQHGKGRATAGERVEMLCDPGTFEEIDTLVTPRYESYLGGKGSRLGDGVVTGFGLVRGRHVCVAAQDATVMGGSLGEMHAAKIGAAAAARSRNGSAVRRTVVCAMRP